MARRFLAADTQYLAVANFFAPPGDVLDVTGTVASVSAWFALSSLGDHMTIFAHWGDSPGVHVSYKWLLFVDPDGTVGFAVANFDDVFSGNMCRSTTVVETNRYYHAIGVKNGTGADSLVLYLNGVAEDSITSSASMGSRPYVPLLVGADGEVAANSLFNGLIAECALWDEALTPDEAVALAAGGYADSVHSSGLLGYWPLRVGSDPETDSSGNGNDLTLVNAPAFDSDNPVSSAVARTGVISGFSVDAQTPAAATVIVNGGRLLFSDIPVTVDPDGVFALSAPDPYDDRYDLISADSSAVVSSTDGTPGELVPADTPDGEIASAVVTVRGPALPAEVDTFDRDDEDPLANTWVSPLWPGDDPPRVVSGECQGSGQAASSAYWPTTTGDGGIIITPVSLLTQFSLYVRISDPDDPAITGYRADINIDAGSVEISRVDDSSTVASLDTATGLLLSVRQRYLFRAIGDALVVRWFDGTQWATLLATTDATYSAAGYAGFGVEADGVIDAASVGDTPYPPIAATDIEDVRVILDAPDYDINPPPNLSIIPGQMVIWFDATHGASRLVVVARDAAGTLVTGDLSLT